MKARLYVGQKLVGEADLDDDVIAGDRLIVAIVDDPLTPTSAPLFLSGLLDPVQPPSPHR